MDLSFIGRDLQPFDVQGAAPPDAAPVDPQEELVRRLIQSLEPSQAGIPPRTPAQPGFGRNILGSLGDAILSMASVRAGGGPVAMGPFAASQHERQKSYEQQMLEYQKRQTENADADRVMRNKARIELSMIGRRTAPAKGQIRMVQTEDENGNPITVPMVFDPITRTLKPIPSTPDSNQPVTSFPKHEADQIVPTSEGVVKVPRNQRGVARRGESSAIAGPSGNTLMPMPSAQMVADQSTQENLRGAFNTAKDYLSTYLSKRSSGSASAGRFATGLATSLPVLGGTAEQAIGYTDPESINTKRSLDRVVQILNYLVSGKQISEQEFARLRPNIPEIGDALPVANDKIARFELELGRIESTRGRLLPGFAGGQDTATRDAGQPSVNDVLDQYKKEFGSGNPTP